MKKKVGKKSSKIKVKKKVTKAKASTAKAPMATANKSEATEKPFPIWDLVWDLGGRPIFKSVYVH